MEDIIEFILELILEGVIEVSSCKKISKWIRYPLILFITLFYLLIILLILLCAVSIYNKSIFLSIVLIVLDLSMIVGGIIKFKKKYITHKNKERL